MQYDVMEQANFLDAGTLALALSKSRRRLQHCQLKGDRACSEKMQALARNKATW